MASNDAKQRTAEDKQLNAAGYDATAIAALTDEERAAALAALQENEDSTNDAGQSAPADDKPKRPAGTKFFRSTVAGLHIKTGDETIGGLSQNVYARFRAYTELFGAELRKVGYMETNDKDLHEKLAADPHVTELTESQYDEQLALPTTNPTLLP